MMSRRVLWRHYFAFLYFYQSLSIHGIIPRHFGVKATAFVGFDRRPNRRHAARIVALGMQMQQPAPPLSLPVWSLAVPANTTASGLDNPLDESTSMNIITFASPVCGTFPTLKSADPSGKDDASSAALWVVSLYRGTRTQEAFCSGFKQDKVQKNRKGDGPAGEGVLQLLTHEQRDLVPLLGMRSGYQKGYSKSKACTELGFPWVTAPTHNASSSSVTTTPLSKNLLLWPDDNLALLPNCAAYMRVQREGSLAEAGNHIVNFCRVVEMGVWDDARGQVVVEPSPSTLAEYGEEDPPLPLASFLDEQDVLYSGLLRDYRIL